MCAISPGTQKAARFRQDPGRPRVPDTVEDERDIPIMPDTPAIRIPAQRQRELACPPFCREMHVGEQPGQRSHWGAGGTVHLPDGTVLLVDVHEFDGQQPTIVLHDSDGNTRTVPAEQALAYAAAIVAAVQTVLTPAVTS